VWIPRFFIAAIAPSIAMIFALLFFPESDIAKCPLFVPTILPQQTNIPEDDTLPIIDIEGHLFSINNTVVMNAPIAQSESGIFLIFLGIILDVRSGRSYYGREGSYHNLTRKGMDVSRALLMSKLDDEFLTDDISDLSDNEIRKNMVQWLTFFLNKYPQVGVLVGRYFDSTGEPTSEWLGLISKLGRRDSMDNGESSKTPKIFPCIFKTQDGRESVSCDSADTPSGLLVPKIIRHRGKSRCACVDEDEIFSVKTGKYAVVHFDDCSDDSTICWPIEFEL